VVLKSSQGSAYRFRYSCDQGTAG